MMKICFLARPSFDKFSTAMFNCLKEKYDSSVEGFFITSNKKETEYIEKNTQNPIIFETSDYLKQNWENFSLEKLIYYEKKYDCAPIWKYIYTDRFLVHRSYEYAVKVTVGLFSFFEDIFEKNKIDFYYSEAIATLQCYIAYLVGKKTGVQYISQMTARGNIDKTFHYFMRDEFQYNYRLILDKPKEHYSIEEWNFAENYLRQFEIHDSPPETKASVRTKPTIDKNFCIAPLRFIKGFFSSYLNDPYSYMYYKGYVNSLNPIIFYFRYHLSKKYYKDPDYREKFVYLPLHYQPEASTLVCAEKYEKQLFLIDSWAKSLPADTVLYVKEHTALLGHRSINFYNELKKYPNVRLITPWASSRTLIEKSCAVAALTGTAGLEAMLLRKPVFVCGNAVYERAPGVIKINDIYDNYVENMKNWKQPTREEIITYLCAWFRSLSKGNIYAAVHPEWLDDNIDLICSSLYKELKELYDDTH